MAPLEKDLLERLLELCDRDLYQPLSNAYMALASHVDRLLQIDVQELLTARTASSAMFQVPAIFDTIAQQGEALQRQVYASLQGLDRSMQAMARCADSPGKLAGMGRTWLTLADKVREMEEIATRLADQPDWKGEASEAHLAVLPRQIEALGNLGSMARSAAESVIVVGAMQSDVFDAAGALLHECIVKLKGHVSSAPAAYYSATTACLTALATTEAAMERILTGEGSWRQAADEIALGLSDGVATGQTWPKAVSGSATTGKGKDKSETTWQTSVSAGGITVTTGGGFPVMESDDAVDDEAGEGSEDVAGEGSHPTLVPDVEPTPIPVPEPTPVPVPEPTPIPVPEPTPVPVPEPTPIPVPEPTPVPVPEPTLPREEPVVQDPSTGQGQGTGPYETTFDASVQPTVEQLENLMLGEQAWDRLYRNDDTLRLMR